MMKKIVALLLVFTCLFSASAFAEGKLKATEKNLIVYPNDDNGYFFAKIENVGDSAIGVGSGDLVAFSDDDDIIFTESYITTLPSYVLLQPGDYLYVREYLWDSRIENATIADYKLSMAARNSSNTFSKIPCEATFDLQGTSSYNNYIYVTFTNTLGEMAYNFYIVAALYDADENLIFVDSASLSSIAVHPDSTVTVKLYVDADLMKYYVANNIVPSTVDAMVLYSDN